jgi:probable HAF family extracellular repeat protein
MSSSFASAMNASGQVVGVSSPPGQNGIAFLWEKGAMIGLGTLAGLYPYASAINAKGEVSAMPIT